MCELLLLLLLLLEWKKWRRGGQLENDNNLFGDFFFFFFFPFLWKHSQLLTSWGVFIWECEGKKARHTHTQDREKSRWQKRRKPVAAAIVCSCFASLARFFVFVFIFSRLRESVRWLLALHCDVMAVALGVRSSLPSYAFLVTLQVEINCSRPLLDPCPIFLLFGHFPPNMEEHTAHYAVAVALLFFYTHTSRRTRSYYNY